MTRAFSVNTTIGFLRTSVPRLYLPRTGRELGIRWRQARSARVVVTLETRSGDVVRTLALRRYAAGLQALVWNGLGRDRKAVRGGRYLVRLVARNDLGRLELVRPVTVQRIVGKKRSGG
jgi:flagellar hook assembly protein FlgD